MDGSHQAILEEVGDPRDVDRDLRSFRNTARILSSSHPRLIDRYPKQWVALYRGRVRASGSTFAAVMAEIDNKGLPREHIIVRFIDRNQRTMIL
jgi:hypothetical protein